MAELDDIKNNEDEEYSSVSKISQLALTSLKYGATIERVSRSGEKFRHAVLKELRKQIAESKDPVLTANNSNIEEKNPKLQLLMSFPDNNKSKADTFIGFDEQTSGVSKMPGIYINTIKSRVSRSATMNFFSNIGKAFSKNRKLTRINENSYEFLCDVDLAKDDIGTIARKMHDDFKFATQIVSKHIHLLEEE